MRTEPIKSENFVFEMSKHASCFAGDLNERKRDGVRGGKDKICVSSFFFFTHYAVARGKKMRERFSTDYQNWGAARRLGFDGSNSNFFLLIH